jgi:hypothetical protein
MQTDGQTERETNISMINFKPYHAHCVRNIKKINLHWFSSLQSEGKVDHKCWQEVEEPLTDLMDEVIGTESETWVPNYMLRWCVTSITLSKSAILFPANWIN